MDETSNLTLLVAAAGGCTSVAMFIVGIYVGRRAERRERANVQDSSGLDRVVAELHGLTVCDGALTDAGAASGPPPIDTSSHPVVEAVRRVVRRGKEVERKLALAQQQLELQTDVIRERTTAAQTDALTGLANRGAFDKVIARRVAEAGRTRQPLSLAFYDIDHFKQCNDVYGHQVGDMVLSIVADVIRGQVREMDVVARYGGEEFAVVMPATELVWAVRGAERIRLAVSRTPLPDDLRHLTTTVSVGVAEYQVGDTVESLVARADKALYASKHGGRNRTSAHDGRAPRPVSVDCVIHSPSEQWSTVSDELKVQLRALAMSGSHATAAPGRPH